MVESASDIVRVMFYWIDRLIYSLITQVYYLFEMLSQTTIFNQEILNDFSKRAYVLISLIMVFKLAFSFITYIVSPDQITDKQKGGGKLIINIVVAIGLLVSVPLIFNEAYYLQGIIVKEGVIEKLVLGNVEKTKKEDAAKRLSAYAFFTFFQPDNKVIGCEKEYGMKISAGCVAALNDVKPKAGDDFKMALEKLDLAYIWNSTLLNANTTKTNKANNFSEEKTYAINYQFFISTLAGGFMCFVLLGFCFDLAIRVVKLGFLQLIAPIPILLSLSPGKKNNTLTNWGKECLITWASLFVRIAVITFSMYLVEIINAEGNILSFISSQSNNNLFVITFIMFGILLFAKEFPKLLEDILGIKMSGKLTLNPWKKLGSVPLIGGLATAGLSYMGNLGKNGISAIRKPGNFRENMRMAGKESLGRLKSSGLGGSDKTYSGDTQHKLVSKRNQDIRDKKFAGKQSLRESRKMWDSGKNSNSRVLDLETADDYKKAGYSDKKFINSKLAINKTKDETESARQTANEAEKQLTAAINRGETDLKAYRDAEAKAHKKYEGLQKALTGLEKTHDESIAVANSRARKDAELDRGRKLASEGSYRPGSFDKPVSYKSGSAASSTPPPVSSYQSKYRNDKDGNEKVKKDESVFPNMSDDDFLN